MGRLEKAFCLVAIMLSSLFAVMCTKSDEVIEDISGLDPDEEEQKEPVRTRDTLYVTGVEYPDGYDWYQDSGYGDVRCFIFLEKEGKKILRVPVGYEYETASDADMHRCFEGHLYTDYSSDSETVFKKDGEEIFRFPGREMNLSFYVRGSDIYTLGVSRSGDPGLTFRINGQVEAFYESGTLLTGFHEDGGRICFAFADLSHGSGSSCRYVFNSDGKLEEFADDQDVSRVLSALKYGGKISYVAECRNISGNGYFFHNGTDFLPFDINGFSKLESVKMLPSSSGLYFSGIGCGGRLSETPEESLELAGQRQYLVWSTYGPRYSLDVGLQPEYSLASGDDIYDFVSTEDYFSEMKLCISGKQKYSYGRNYRILAAEPAAVVKGSVHLVLSGTSWPRRPAVAVDGKIRDGGFNGYYTSVTVW